MEPFESTNSAPWPGSERNCSQSVPLADSAIGLVSSLTPFSRSDHSGAPLDEALTDKHAPCLSHTALRAIHSNHQILCQTNAAIRIFLNDLIEDLAWIDVSRRVDREMKYVLVLTQRANVSA
jgi:hypothetical protein